MQLAGLLKEDVNPYEDEFDRYTLKAGLVTRVKSILAKHNIPEDSTFSFQSLKNDIIIDESATVEEAVDAFLEIVNSKFPSIEDWILAINEQEYEDWLDDQRSNANLTDDEYADFEPDYEMDEDELIDNTEELVEDVIDDNIVRDRKWNSWGIMFYGLTRTIGSCAWKVTKPE